MVIRRARENAIKTAAMEYVLVPAETAAVAGQHSDDVHLKRSRAALQRAEAAFKQAEVAVRKKDIVNHGRDKDKKEVPVDVPGEDNPLLTEINTIKETCLLADQPESVVFEALQRLENMHISASVLKSLRVQKKVKMLRKHASARVNSLAKKLKRRWKLLAAEAKSTKTTIVPPSSTDDGDGVSSPHVAAQMQPRNFEVDVTKLFGFLDGYDCEHFCEGDSMASSPKEPLVKDSLASVLHQRDVPIKSGAFDAEERTSSMWERRMEERRHLINDGSELHKTDRALQRKGEDATKSVWGTSRTDQERKKRKRKRHEG